MTLIMAAAGHGCLVQVTDRKVTLKRNAKLHDPHANKAVVVIGTDGALIIGHFGLAYFADTPVDQAIAEAAAAQPLPDGMFIGRDQNDPMDVWSITQRVRARVQSELPTGTSGTTVPIVGLVVKRDGRPRHLCWKIEQSSGAYVVSRGPRPQPQEPPPIFFGGSGGPAASASMKRRLERDGIARGLDEFEQRLVDIVAEVAEDEPTVSADSMAIRVTLEARNGLLMPSIRTQFHPSAETLVGLRVGSDQVITPAAFTPWLVTPLAVLAPGVAIGGGSWDICGITYEVITPAHAEALGTHFTYMGSQVRKGPPGRPDQDRRAPGR